MRMTFNEKRRFSGEIMFFLGGVSFLMGLVFFLISKTPLEPPIPINMGYFLMLAGTIFLGVAFKLWYGDKDK